MNDEAIEALKDAYWALFWSGDVEKANVIKALLESWGVETCLTKP